MREPDVQSERKSRFARVFHFAYATDNVVVSLSPGQLTNTRALLTKYASLNLRDALSSFRENCL